MEKNNEDIEEDTEKYPLLDEKAEEITKKDSNDNIYSEETRDELLEDDELTSEEAGFMQGYDEAYS